MILLDLIRRVRGSVHFSATGDFAERFLNLCARNNIPVWNARSASGRLRGHTLATHYPRMRKYAKITGMRLRIIKKSGLPFARHRYRKRHGLFVGLGAFLAFLYIMSMFIWRIEISGNIGLPESRIIAALQTLNIKAGSWRPGIDVRASERRALLAIPELSWIALNIDGSTLCVEVDERTIPPAVVDPTDPCNIIAAKSGQILRIALYDGQLVVKEGDGVAAGDLLVSGITEDRMQQNRFRHARANVIARTAHTITVKIPLQQTRYLETGAQKTRRYIAVFGLQLPLHLPHSMPAPYRVERREWQMSFFSAPLPVLLHTEEYILMEEIPVTLTEQEARQLALREIAAIEQLELGGAEILQRSARATLSRTHFSATVDYIVNMDIGRQQSIPSNTEATP